MWLCTRYDFFSVVRGDDRISPGKVMVRARKAGHLRNLQGRFAELRDVPLKTSSTTDYPCRLVVNREVWARIGAELAADIDYTNFKNAAGGELADDSDYSEFLHEVWWKGMQLLQRSEE
ncbi:hypothetical protein STSP2_03292 [Anaerohalosphaera lusitana]|uniref:Uncharacterized protein n=1 Tax=Anaerohalosphaera lusitana TaxID=1936003 RepID=A0A1U9NR38_9BACT|nr:hypothetical protein [Anaerohalosphaera lusitana]AQT70090.1 hypothetical protein STSP2_03292 [Anaerohalosphaera lusitana]